MSKKLSAKAAGTLPIADIINGINTAAGIADATMPLIKALFEKVNQFILTLGKDNPNSPKNVRLRLSALEAKDKLQKELNKLFEERLAALEK